MNRENRISKKNKTPVQENISINQQQQKGGIV